MYVYRSEHPDLYFFRIGGQPFQKKINQDADHRFKPDLQNKFVFVKVVLYKYPILVRSMIVTYKNSSILKNWATIKISWTMKAGLLFSILALLEAKFLISNPVVFLSKPFKFRKHFFYKCAPLLKYIALFPSLEKLISDSSNSWAKQLTWKTISDWTLFFSKLPNVW